MNVLVPLKSVNAPQLKLELDAASGGTYQGFSTGAKWPGQGILHFADNATQAQVDAALLAYANHDPNVRTAAQMLQARRIAAEGELATADFLAVLNQINAATSLADAKPIMKALLRLMYRMALAQGLTDVEDPEG